MFETGPDGSLGRSIRLSASLLKKGQRQSVFASLRVNMTTVAGEGAEAQAPENTTTAVPGTGPLGNVSTSSSYDEHVELWKEAAQNLERDMGMSESRGKELCLELFRGLVCKSYAEDLSSMAFPPLINIAWNVAMLSSLYRPMCNAVFGYEINQSPQNSTRSLVKCIAATKQNYAQLFSMEPPESHWGVRVPVFAAGPVNPTDNGVAGHKRRREEEVDGASSSKVHKGYGTATASSSSKPLSRLTLMSDDTLVVYFETVELGKAVECIMSSTTRIGEFFELIEQHIGLKDPRYMTAYDVRVNPSDTCESLGLNDRDTVTLFPQ